MEKGVTRLGAELPYERAAKTYTALTRVGISAKSVEVITKRNGRALGEVMARERAQAMAGNIEPPGPRKGEEEALPWGVSIDGTSVLTREGWKEVKLGAVFQFGEVSDEVKAKNLSYCAGLWKADEVGEALWAETRRRGIDTVYEDVEVVIGDGAVWIWDLAQTHYPYAAQIVDWYHAEERLWTVGQAVYGQGAEGAKAWVEGRLAQLWDGDLSGVQHQLRGLKPRRSEVREIVRQAVVYFTNQAGRMQYPSYREKGYPLGSGPVESACKNLVGARLKRGGMRWSNEGAQAVLNLRSELLSNRWDEAWQHLRRLL